MALKEEQFTRTRIWMFGGFKAVTPAGAAVSLPTRKATSLFCYIAFRAGREISRDLLASTFWPAVYGSAGRNSLSVALSAIRKVIEPAPELENKVLTGDHRSVCLNTDFIWSDVEEFQRAIRGAEVSDNSERRFHLLRKAAELYEGQFLEGDEEPWALAERHSLDQIYFRAVIKLLECADNPDDMHTALNVGSRAQRFDPRRRDVEERMNRAREELRLLERDKYARQSLQVKDSVVEYLETKTHSEVAPVEAAGGAMPLHSNFYVERDADQKMREAIDSLASIVLVKGPRQVGKSSLLARALEHSRKKGYGTACIDLQAIDSSCLASADTLYKILSNRLAEDLKSTPATTVDWDERLSPGMNLERALKSLISAAEAPTFIALDEIDCIFTCPFASDFFALLRSWHNRRALDPSGPWGNLCLGIGYSTEAHLFIKNINQSPFNVGVRLSLEDFSIRQVAELNQRHGQPMKDLGELEKCHSLLNGHPYLVSVALSAMRSNQMPFSVFIDEALKDGGAFKQHLEDLLRLIKHAGMVEPARRVVEKQPIDPETFFQLRSMGVVSGRTQEEARMRCALYQTHLAKGLDARG